MRRIIRCWICAAAAGLLITGLLLTRMPVCAASLIIPEEYCYQDAFYYQITDADEIIITRSRSTLTFLNVPEQINGHTVTQIAERAFLIEPV